MEKKPLDQPAKAFLSLIERKDNTEITPDTYQNLPPSNQNMYNFGREKCRDPEQDKWPNMS
jgi:hypothetical protein